MSLYLAIDAGGTKAEYVLAGDSRILARTRSATIKRMRTSAETAAANLAGALGELSQLAGVTLQQITHTCVGTAGNTVPLVTDFLRTEISARVGGSLLLLGDVEIALDAAFPGASGILILAGTGSNVAGRSASGQLFNAGGHGPVLADQGSGHRIGEQALRSVFLALDEGRTTTLLDAILVHWQLSTADDLVAYANTCPHSTFSTLPPIVLRCAQAGDEVASQVLAREGGELAHLASLVHRHIERADGTYWQPRFAFAGSIMEHVPPVRDALTSTLLQQIPGAQFLPGVVDPVLGALYRARHA